MKKQILTSFINVFLVVIILLQFGAWDNTKPADNSLWNNAAPEIRANNDALEVELGVDLNEAHPYFQASAPDKKPDTTTSLDADDHGRLWVDSDDNIIYVLTAFGGPTWTSTASASDIISSDPTFTLTNTDVEDSDGGRQSQFIGKGTQSGSELTTLGFTEFSHDGTSDDEKGKWRVVLNSGSETNTPTNVPIEYTADGKIKVATSLSVLDEDDMSSDGDKVVATQQSIKAYVDSRRAYIKLFDSKASGNAGGTFTTGAWQKRTVTEDTDTGSNVSVASSVIVLAAGTYECRIQCPAQDVNRHQARLQNTTGASTIFLGSSQFSSTAGGVNATSVIVGRFTIAASQNLEIQHRCETTKTDDGFGVDSAFGVNTIYTIAEFWKI